MPMPWPRALDAQREPVRAADGDAPPGVPDPATVPWIAPPWPPSVEVAFWLGDNDTAAGPP